MGKNAESRTSPDDYINKTTLNAFQNNQQQTLHIER